MMEAYLLDNACDPVFTTLRVFEAEDCQPSRSQFWDIRNFTQAGIDACMPSTGFSWGFRSVKAMNKKLVGY